MRCSVGMWIVLSGLLWAGGSAWAGDACLECHRKKTPNIVKDWQLSRHQTEGVTCSDCHGTGHKDETDAKAAGIPTPDVCADCHSEQVEQFKRGKHALAWAAMKAMPTFHWQPIALTEGMKGCGGCHSIGVKTKEEIAAMRQKGASFGIASCDACHTRHLFSAEEAAQPQACQTCHMGFDHPQWEMYSSSKHGVRNSLKQLDLLPESAAAPTCQTCHMQDGDHENRTAWGFLAVRLPMPKDPKWAADRTVILKALGVLDPQGKPTARLEVVKKAQVARLTQEAWEKEREKMLHVCSRCHARAFAEGELRKGDRMIKEADSLMAEAIRIVASLYKKGVLKKPKSYAYAYPDLLTFHDAATPIEQRLFVMFLKHRMRTFQGAFHSNPDYSLWYGWSAMRMDLAEIKQLAQQMRSAKAAAK